MEDSLSKDIENSNDGLVQLIRQHVERILHEYHEQTGNFDLLNYDIRNDAVLFTYEKITKKWLNDSRFETKKDEFIRHIVIDYLFSTGLQDSE